MTTTVVVLPSLNSDNVSQSGETSLANVARITIPNSANPFATIQYCSLACNISIDQGYANQNVANSGLLTLNVISISHSSNAVLNPFDSFNMIRYQSLGDPKQTIAPNSGSITKYPNEP
jgi:hypothetical protein